MASQAARPSPAGRSKPFYRQARPWMALLLVLGDLASLFLAALAAVGLRALLNDVQIPPVYWSLAPLLLLFLGVYALRGLYPAVGLSPVEELRRLSTTTSLVFLFLAGLSFWTRTGEVYSRLILAFTWLLALFSVPFGRWIVRILAVQLNLWGEPVVVAGYGPQAQQIIEFLQRRMRFGLRPAAILIGPDFEPAGDPPLPLVRLDPHGGMPAELAGIRSAILIASELPPELKTAIVDQGRFGFQHLILISDLRWIGSLGVVPYDLEGMLGLEIRQNLFNPWQQGLKRSQDLLLSLGLGLLALPFLALIALLVRLDSPGGVFYRQQRVGLGGRPITVVKFRTMYQDSGEVLASYLHDRPQRQAEWQATHKLADDPRLTRVGRLLRRASLDELPQLWNVLKGQMSWVGPRPFLPDEMPHYLQNLAVYQRVRPGITGLWQVSGRGGLSFAERVRYDEYYVRNWSLWLDLYILLRTAWVVLRGEGAY